MNRRVQCLESGCDEEVREPFLLHHLNEAHGVPLEEAHERILASDTSDFLDPPDVSGYDDDFLIELYRTMRLVRSTEETLLNLSDRNDIPGHPHTSIGQEGCSVGTCSALDREDVIGSTHRGHGHVLAKGADLKEVVAEIGGKETGTNGGRGGTMHMADYPKGILGQNAIVGASAPHVAGAMLRGKLAGEDRMGVAFMGEGGLNQGITPETMNMASIFDLPVVFLCENNQYQITFNWKNSLSNREDFPSRARAFDIPGKTVNGANVLAVHEAVVEARERALEESRPSFIECQTYRHTGHYGRGHSKMAGQGLVYRPDEEEEYWIGMRDPIETFAGVLAEEGILSEDDRAAIDEEIDDDLEEAVEFMRESEYPPEESVLSDVYEDDAYENFPATTYR